MSKNFRLYARLRHTANFVQWAFPSQHHPVIAEVPGKNRVVGVGKSHLSTGMELQRGKLVPHQRRHAQVLHDHRVCARMGDGSQGLPNAGELLLLHQRIDGHMNPGMMQVSVFHRPRQRLVVKIHSGSPGSKGLGAQIHRVRAAVHRGMERFFASGRAKQLRNGMIRFHGTFSPPGRSPSAFHFQRKGGERASAPPPPEASYSFVKGYSTPLVSTRMDWMR